MVWLRGLQYVHHDSCQNTFPNGRQVFLNGGQGQKGFSNSSAPDRPLQIRLAVQIFCFDSDKDLHCKSENGSNEIF